MMRRRTFVTGASASLLLIGTPWRRAVAAEGGLLSIYRAAPTSQDGQTLYDIALGYSFPSVERDSVYVDGYGHVPRSGYLRFVTASPTITVRDDVTENHEQDPVLASLVLEKVVHDFQYLSSIDLANIDDVARSLVTGAALYGLGRDDDAIREYTGVLYDKRRLGVWSSQARLGRADAYANVGNFAAARRDYEWIIQRPGHYLPPELGIALLGNARVLTLLGDLPGALSAYQKAQVLYKRISRRPILAATDIPSIRSDAPRVALRDAIQAAVSTSANALAGSGLAAANIGAAVTKLEIDLSRRRGITIKPGPGGRITKFGQIYDVAFEPERAGAEWRNIDQSSPWSDDLKTGTRFSIADIINQLSGTFFWAVQSFPDLANFAYVSTWSRLQLIGNADAPAMRCALVIDTIAADRETKARNIPYRAKIVTAHRGFRGTDYDPKYDDRKIDPSLLAATNDFAGFLTDLCRALARA